MKEIDLIPDIDKIKTIGDLKKSGYKDVSVKDELRQNLIAKLKENEDLIHPRFDVNGDLCEEDNGEGKYFNKHWFEKDDDGDFILWKMIQNS